MNRPETVLERYTAAVKNVDKDALLALYSPNARIFDMTMPWEHRDMESWSNMVGKWLSHVRGTNGGAEASNIETHTTDSMVLMTMLMEYYDTNENGERESMTNRLSWVLVPDGDDWTILHEHTSVPLNEADMTPQFEP